MRNYINLVEAIEKGCPPATQSIELNLKNRQKAIDEYHYGPLNPNEPNEEYWAELADRWNTDDIDSVKHNRCGNCAAFDMSEGMMDCIAKGIGSEPGSDPMSTIDAGHLGYCKFLKFKCAAKRTCDAWVEGGPVTESKNSSDLKTYRARVRLPDQYNTTVIETQVVARNYDLAVRQLKAQYGQNSLVSTVTEVK